MSEIKNILFPTDGSPNSKKALNYVKEFANKVSANVTVLTVYEPPILNGIEMVPYSYAEIEKNIIEIAEGVVDEAKKELETVGINVTTRIEQGHTGSAVTEIAQNGFDLIIMGSRGLSSFKSFLLGSVSNFVIHNTECPVLLIKGE